MALIARALLARDKESKTAAKRIKELQSGNFVVRCLRRIAKAVKARLLQLYEATGKRDLAVYALLVYSVRPGTGWISAWLSAVRRVVAALLPPRTWLTRSRGALLAWSTTVSAIQTLVKFGLLIAKVGLSVTTAGVAVLHPLLQWRSNLDGAWHEVDASVSAHATG